MNTETALPRTKETQHGGEGFVRKGMEFLKRYWLVALLTACTPSEGERKEDFERFFAALTSGREDREEFRKLIKTHGLEKYEQNLLENYDVYAGKLDTLFTIVPIDEIARYFASYGFDRSKLDASVFTHHVFPGGLPGELNAGISREFRILVIDPSNFTPGDTLKFTRTFLHEYSHFFINESGFPHVLNEGYAELSELNFAIHYLRERGYDDDRIRSHIQQEGTGYQAETLLVGLVAALQGVEDNLRTYYQSDEASLRKPFDRLAAQDPDVGLVIHKDIFDEKTKTFRHVATDELLTVIRALVQQHGYASVQDAYQNLVKNYFMDAAAINLGRLFFKDGLVYFDNTYVASQNKYDQGEEKMEGSYSFLAANGKVVTLIYSPFGMKDYLTLLASIKGGLSQANGRKEVIKTIHPELRLVNKRGGLTEGLVGTLQGGIRTRSDR